MEEKNDIGCETNAGLVAKNQTVLKKKFKNYYKIECFTNKGKLRWVEEFPNMVVLVGLDHTLDVTLSGGSQISTWYVGLKNTGSVAAADTMASHAGWTENTTYSDANRPAWSDGGVSSQSVDNSLSKANFNINGTTTIFGAFLCSNNTKGGTSGTLYGAGNFAASRDVYDGDVLVVTITCTASSV